MMGHRSLWNLLFHRQPVETNTDPVTAAREASSREVRQASSELRNALEDLADRLRERKPNDGLPPL